MLSAQPGIFAQGTRSHHYLEFDLKAGVPVDDIRTRLGMLREPQVTAGGLNLVIGVGPDLMRRLAPTQTPESLEPFTTINGITGRSAPGTQHDLFLWLHGTGPDVVLDGAVAATALLEPAMTLVTDQPAFVYRDSRDMTGFIDGTENPVVEEAPDVAIVQPGQPGEGGSHIVVMRWVHDLDAFQALPEEEQQGIIGRTKPDSLELGDDEKPQTAHIARVVIEEDGEELEIYRRSTPFGTVTERGLEFVAFSADPTRFEKMLNRMFGLSGDGLHDRLTDFSQPTTGSFYFAPSLDCLEAMMLFAEGE
jgi:putative iron-dependent peroxidase